MRIMAFLTAALASAGRWALQQRRPLAMLSALALSAGLAACGEDEQDEPAAEKIELSIVWWGGAERAELTNKVLDLYTQKHPNVTFKRQSLEWKEYYTKLDAMTAGGSGVDLFQIEDSGLSERASRGVTMDLSDHVSSKKIDLSRMPESLAKYGELGGKPYGIPNAENTPAMIYDKTVIQQYGVAEPQISWSYDQLIAWGREIATKSGGTVTGTMDPSADYKALWLWLRAQGKELYNGNQLGCGTEDLVRWFELWAGARQAGATASVEA
ncbi:MAG: extracellular solute-binding protein, partial [Micromonosporaceae bacterium]|nr:extracellular solute-binding protein [Micromonosporaceae bacterium]